jgi:hypothetical protein
VADAKRTGRVIWRYQKLVIAGNRLGLLTPSRILKKHWASLRIGSRLFLTLQTSIIAAVAVFVGLTRASDFVHLSIGQLISLGVAGVSSLTSIIVGLYLLNMIPAAAQLKPNPFPADVPKDLFSIATQKHGKTIRYWADLFRYSFLSAVTALIAFVVLRMTSIF